MIHEGLLTSVRDYKARFRKPAPSLHETWLATMTEAQRGVRRKRSGAACVMVILASTVALLGTGPDWSPVAGDLMAFTGTMKAIWC
jgi:hypothetical protein